MATVSRVKTWIANETLTAADLNAEFNNILNGINSNALDSSNLDATDTYVMAELVVGSGISNADGGQLHVHTASAGSITAETAADDIVVENSGDTGITILSGTTSNGAIYFGDSGDNDIGKIDYDHNSNTLALTVNTAEVISFTSANTVFNDPGNDVDFRIETNNIANGFVVDGGLDVFSFGAAAADDKFVTISPPAATHTATTDTYALHVTAGGAQTIPSGTTALVASVVVEEPNITATGTVTNAATVYIKNAPTEGGSNYALWVDDGAVKFDAALTVGTDVSVGDDLLLTSSGSVINWNSGDITLTHTAGKLTWGGDGAVELDFNNHEITNVDIDSGAIDGTTVGASSASSGAFTTLSATGDVSFDGGSFVFNESGADKDFRIEGDGLNDLFVADASTDRIGIGTDTPDSLLDITGDNNGGLIGMVIQNIGRHSVELRMHATGPEDGGDYSLLVGGQNGGYDDKWGLYDNNASAFRVVVESDGGVFMNALLAASASTDVNINGSNELHSVTSSGRYKEDYSSGTGSDRVMDLQPRTFTWRHPVDAPDGWAQQVGEPGRRDFGLIAEEVAEVMPELVNYKDGKPYSVRYQMMSVLLLEQLQELKDEIEALKKTA